MSASVAVSNGARRVALCLGTLATGASIAITFFAGRERGGDFWEQAVWIAIGAVLLLAAHFLPAISNGTKARGRVVAWILWAGAILSTGYSHGTFFLAAQHHAGDVRAKEVSVPAAILEGGSSGDKVANLLRQQARLQGAAGQLALAKCAENCRVLAVQRQTVQSQLEAVKGELAEAHRYELASDRREAERARALARQDGQREDPVSSGLSAIFGVPTGTINLGIALFLGWLLEGTACFCWYLALSGCGKVDIYGHKIPVDETTPTGGATGLVGPRLAVIHFEARQSAVNDPVSPENLSEAYSCGPKDDVREERHATLSEVADQDEESRLRHALAVGEATGAISEIVELLGCTEGRALALRRYIAVTDPRLLLAQKRLAG